MSFSQVLSSLKPQAKAIGVSEESFFLHQLHKVAAGGSPVLLQNLVNYANSLGMVATAAIINDLLQSSLKIARNVEVKSGYLTVTGSDSLIIPADFLVGELFVEFVSPSEPSYITCSPSPSDSVTSELLVHNSFAHNLKITWNVLGTRTIKWLVKK
jgi:hypothetical protein